MVFPAHTGVGVFLADRRIAAFNGHQYRLPQLFGLFDRYGLDRSILYKKAA